MKTAARRKAHFPSGKAPDKGFEQRSRPVPLHGKDQQKDRRARISRIHPPHVIEQVSEDRPEGRAEIHGERVPHHKYPPSPHGRRIRSHGIGYRGQGRPRELDADQHGKPQRQGQAQGDEPEHDHPERQRDHHHGSPTEAAIGQYADPRGQPRLPPPADSLQDAPERCRTHGHPAEQGNAAPEMDTDELAERGGVQALIDKRHDKPRRHDPQDRAVLPQPRQRPLLGLRSGRDAAVSARHTEEPENNSRGGTRAE